MNNQKTTLNHNLHRNISKLIKDAESILIISHIRPDGDAIGSLLGLGLSLQKVGKSTQMILVDGVPDLFLHLPGNEKVVKDSITKYDLSIVVDCSDLDRTGYEFYNKKPDINIDHHVTNTNFAQYNIVESDSVATAAVLANYLPHWDLPIDKDVSECLITGIITDTIGFRTSNMNAFAFRTVADLLENGANLSDLYFKAIINRSFEAAKFWGVGLSKMSKENELIWSVITNKERQLSTYNQRDDAELSNFLSTIDDSSISILFMEQQNGSVKVSWLAKPGYDVAKIASDFGGGGHQAAAGADINDTLEAVVEKVLAETKEVLANH